jgi:hypothetical protein
LLVVLFLELQNQLHPALVYYCCCGFVCAYLTRLYALAEEQPKQHCSEGDPKRGAQHVVQEMNFVNGLLLALRAMSWRRWLVAD